MILIHKETAEIFLVAVEYITDIGEVYPIVGSIRLIHGQGCLVPAVKHNKIADYFELLGWI